MIYHNFLLSIYGGVMIDIFRFEFLNIVKRKETKIVFTIFLASVILNFIATCYFQYGFLEMNIRSSLDTVALNNMNSLFISDVFKIFFPVLVALIYSDSYFIESKNNITQFIYTRIDIKKTMIIRLSLIFIVSALIVLIPLILNYILVIFTFPEVTANKNLGGKVYNIYNYDLLNMLSKEDNMINFFDYLYVYNQHYYNFLIILIKAVSGGVFAVLAFALSFYINKSRIIVIFSSFFVCLAGVYLPEILPFFDIELIYTADQFLLSDVIITCSIIFIASIMLVLNKLKRGINT